LFQKLRLKVSRLKKNVKLTPKSVQPLNPLKGTLKSSLIFNEFPLGSGVKQLKINELTEMKLIQN